MISFDKSFRSESCYFPRMFRLKEPAEKVLNAFFFGYT
jgi:hypothetical protein